MSSYAWSDGKATVSDHARIPPAVFWFEALKKNKDLVVSDETSSGHWIKTYCAKNFVRADRPADIAKLATLPAVEASFQKMLLKPPSGQGPKLLVGKSLYDTALALKNGGDPAKSTGEAKGLERALRYYMLATYSLLDTLAIAGKADQVGNYVAAMLVGQDGNILAAGINVGKFMHAEVSLLLSYFLAHKGESHLPEKSLVFSTLTPCMQCTKFLMESRSAKTLMYFGQMDKGDFGNIGALDVAGFKKAVADDAKKEYDLSYLGDDKNAETMSLPGIFGKAPKVYNVNQAEINNVVQLISDLKNKKVIKSPAYQTLTDLDFRVGKKKIISNTAGQLKDKPAAKQVFSAAHTTLAGKDKIAHEKAKTAKDDDIAFRAIQSDVLDYLNRSLTEIQFYA